ncbi:MarR family winged helix-turn-helix transcriptional regulator [Actinokineospora enzanensis]|uniref:MarR family winged helix-turn-helix transcriptional regulator n=1 Tax=Actinokineospora enzanensis TaxID=155975 RepID=UPI000372C8C6|nr:MarR family transcriptional regulator [Actinokineospora enzanensis]
MEVTNNQSWALVRQLWTVAQHVRRGQAASPHNAVTVQLLALAAEHGPLRPQDVVSLLDVTAPSATRYVQALEQAGQIDVIADANDGRTYLIQVNEKGREVLDSLRDDLLEAMRPVIGDFDQEEIETLLDLLGRLTASMAEHAQTRPARPSRKNRWRAGA